MFSHYPVMLAECIASLAIKADGVYVDCTFGGGGHSKAILQQLGDKGKLFAFDCDYSRKDDMLINDARFTLVPYNYSHLKKFLRFYHIDKVDGILADLGVSSFQLDNQERGFSYQGENALLDMRMDNRMEKTAATVLNTYAEKDLQYIFQEYGEVVNAKTISKCIVEQRNKMVLASVGDLKKMLMPYVKGNPHKYWAKLFQALRIEVNQELQNLEYLLIQAGEVLKEEGRLVVLTFHSLEDRIVKQALKHSVEKFSKDNLNYQWELVNKKVIIPSLEEQKKNTRSRSAKLRVAKKIKKQ